MAQELGERCSQRRPSSSYAAVKAARSFSPTGKPAALLAAQSAASSGLAKQFTAVLLPMPRGSQLTMSNRSRTSRGKDS
ncbi:hypothetical protein SALBM311S_01153 [Streptomyces alboniger]